VPAGAKPPGGPKAAPKPAPAPSNDNAAPKPVLSPTGLPNGAPVKTETTFPTSLPGAVPPVTVKPDDPAHMARELALHLSTLQLGLGGAKQAKGKENKTLVRSFQKGAGLTADGEAGPATLIAVARRGVGTLPLVMYWPKGANAKTVAAYRTALRAIAAEAPAQEAEALRYSANRERGQGGITGPLAPEVAGSSVPQAQA
jgi:peptidoglycan hydrolase-like protein with peptidoglycan-binding domain